ncbi:MAG: hypothetical protein ACLQBA_12545 [Candidatus Binataceae bacterium]
MPSAGLAKLRKRPILRRDLLIYETLADERYRAAGMELADDNRLAWDTDRKEPTESKAVN